MVSTIQPKTKEHNAFVPPLEQGDRLTRQEFHRRYAAMPHIKKAELIEGIAHTPSPVNYTSHGKPHAHIITLLGIYAAATEGVELADNATVILDADNEVQPDALMRLVNGTSRLDPDGYIEGAPEFIAEIAASSASYELYDKMQVYRRNHVKEYLVWQVYDERIDWFYLDEGRYQALPATEEGILRSRTFPGLHVHAQALLQDNLAAAVETVQVGLQSPEHASFIQKLSTQKEPE